MNSYAHAFISKDFYLTNLIYAMGDTKKSRLIETQKQYAYSNTRSAGTHQKAAYMIVIPLDDYNENVMNGLNNIYPILYDGLHRLLHFNTVNCMIAEHNGGFPKKFPSMFKITASNVNYQQKQIKAEYGMSCKLAVGSIPEIEIIQFGGKKTEPPKATLNKNATQLSIFDDL